MKKRIIVFLILLFFLGIIIFLSNNSDSALKIENKVIEISDGQVEKIEIVHFHATRQCWACITLGNLALKTIKTEFSEEYQEGKIIFIDINADLPKNSAVVQKYKARGSSLFINVIIDGKDNIEEDITAWRFVSNENNFNNYFKDKLNGYLIK